MKLVIDISEDVYEHFLSRYKYQDKNDIGLSDCGIVGVAIKNGTPLPKQKIGKWIKKEYWKPLPYDTEPLDYDHYDEKTHSEIIYLYCCSECGKDEGEIKPTDKYCPNCGIKMEVEE